MPPLSQAALLDALAAIVGARHVLTEPHDSPLRGGLAGPVSRRRARRRPAGRHGAGGGVGARGGVGGCRHRAAGRQYGPRRGRHPVRRAIPRRSARARLFPVADERHPRVDPVGLTLTAEAGCILKTAQDAAAAAGRLLPVSLAAEGSAQLGGVLSANAGGINVMRYGMSRQLALGLEVVLPDGSVVDGLRRLRKDNAGYDWKQLFIGAEGTLGIVTAAVLRLAPRPRERVTSLLAVPGPAAALPC